MAQGYCFADAEECSPLTVESEWSWEGAPGGENTYCGEVAEVAVSLGCGTATHTFDTSCSVPTVSALGLDQSPFVPIPPPGAIPAPFDAYTWSAENQPHLVLEPAVAAWLLDELVVVTPDAPANQHLPADGPAHA